MTEAEIISLVRQTIKQELAPILMGKVTSTESPERATVQRYSIETPIPEMRNILPYGIASRPPTDMECLTIPIASDPTHLNMVGQFDSKRPAVEPGDVCFYGPNKQEIWMRADGMIKSGILGAASPAVLGDVLKELLTNILKAFLDSPALGTCAVGPVMLDPGIRAKLVQEQSMHIDAAATNFLAQRNFLDRGAT